MGHGPIPERKQGLKGLVIWQGAFIRVFGHGPTAYSKCVCVTEREVYAVLKQCIGQVLATEKVLKTLIF